MDIIHFLSGDVPVVLHVRNYVGFAIQHKDAPDNAYIPFLFMVPLDIGFGPGEQLRSPRSLLIAYLYF